MGKLLLWLTNLYQKEVIKYQQASRPEDNVQKIRLAGKNLVSIKGNTDGMLSRLCVFHFAQCTAQGIKARSENKVTGLAH